MAGFILLIGVSYTYVALGTSRNAVAIDRDVDRPDVAISHRNEAVSVIYTILDSYLHVRIFLHDYRPMKRFVSRIFGHRRMHLMNRSYITAEFNRIN